MDHMRRRLLLGVPAALGLCAASRRVLAAEPQLGDDGLYIQDWFVESFLDLQEDLTDAADNGKHFAVLWEQRGCPYCRELHTVNLTRPKVRSFLEENFDILQLDLWGSRAVTDFDGEELEERALARKWQVNFTPTVVFFPQQPQVVKGKTGRSAEVARMPGYFPPFEFATMFEYVRGGHHETQSFQRYLRDRSTQLEAAGKKAGAW